MQDKHIELYNMIAGAMAFQLIEDCKSLDDICKKYEKAEPETILSLIRLFFISAGRDYQLGVISETEFYSVTNPFLVWESLLKRKGIVLNHEFIFRHYEDLEAAFYEWMEGEKLTGESYSFLRSALIRNGDLKDVADWFFRVLDTVKLPLSFFLPMEIPDKRLPAIIWEIGYDTIQTILTKKCRNINNLITDPNPVGKNFVLYFNDCYDKVELEIKERRKNYYMGTGIIDGYTLLPQTIEIEIDENGAEWIRFNKRTFSREKLLFGSYIYPIPHPDWNEYNEMRIIKGLKIEEEYKRLRIPYMIGVYKSAEIDLLMGENLIKR